MKLCAVLVQFLNTAVVAVFFFFYIKYSILDFNSVSCVCKQGEYNMLISFSVLMRFSC